MSNPNSIQGDSSSRSGEASTVLGVSLRDYFIAHAPAEPQSWFSPTMLEDIPELPPFPEPITEEQKKEAEYVREYRSVMDPSEPKTPIMRAHVAAYKAAVKARAAWSAERNKQHYVQWLAAWADEMLRARAALSNTGDTQ